MTRHTECRCSAHASCLTAAADHFPHIWRLRSFDAEDSSAPLYFTDKAKESRFFSGMRPEVVADLAAKPYARESHSRGLSLKSFDANPALKEAYEVLSLSNDPEGEVRSACGPSPVNPRMHAPFLI